MQKLLLLIRQHGLLYPNSGSLFEALNFFHKKICGLSDNKWKFCDLDVLISIVVDIAHRNPRTYPNCAAILSKLINRENDALEKQKTFEKIHNRFKELPNTNYMEIWLQRISLKISNYETSNFNEKLCRIICSSSENDDKIWEDDWISSCVLKRALDPCKLINLEEINGMDPVVSGEEIELFSSAYC